MSAIFAKLIKPATYTQAWASTARAAQAHYHPIVRDNGATPLWHGMVVISVIMYSSTYFSRVYPDVLHDREIKRIALAEYYEKHGGSAHH